MRGSHHGEENAPGSTAYGYAGTPGGYPEFPTGRRAA